MNKRKTIAFVLATVATMAIAISSGVMLYAATHRVERSNTTPSVTNISIDRRANNKEVELVAENELIDRQVYFSGIEDCIVDKNSVVLLENRKENRDFYMAYEISVDGNVIFSTEMIPSGNHIQWKPSNYLTAGTYIVSFKQMPYYEKDGEYIQLTSPTNEVEITVID